MSFPLFTATSRALFPIGDFINAAVSFLLVAAAVYFFVVTPINALVSRMRKAPAPADPTTKKCPEPERDSSRRASLFALQPARSHSPCSLELIHCSRARVLSRFHITKGMALLRVCI